MMTRRIRERINKLEKQIPSDANETPFDKAMKKIFEEATAEELRVVIYGFSEYGETPSEAQKLAMQTEFEKRARAKIRSEPGGYKQARPILDNL